MIYFVQAGVGGAIKIGFTKHGEVNRRRGFTLSGVMARVKNLQCGNPEPLSIRGTMPGSKRAEAELHIRFAALHIRGEWFRPDELLLDFIEAQMRTYPQTESVPEPRTLADKVRAREKKAQDETEYLCRLRRWAKAVSESYGGVECSISTSKCSLR